MKFGFYLMSLRIIFNFENGNIHKVASIYLKAIPVVIIRMGQGRPYS